MTQKVNASTLFFSKTSQASTAGLRTMTSAKYKIVVEQHEDGFVAYPLGFAGCVVGQGDSANEAIADVQSAIRFHIETFGKDAFADDSPLLHAYVTETELVNAD